MSDQVEKTNAEIQSLKVSVAGMQTAEQSAITLIGGLSAQLKAAIASASNSGATTEQLADLTALQTSIDGGTQQLAAAVTANTPSADTTGVPTGASTVSGSAGGTEAPAS